MTTTYRPRHPGYRPPPDSPDDDGYVQPETAFESVLNPQQVGTVRSETADYHRMQLEEAKDGRLEMAPGETLPVNTGRQVDEASQRLKAATSAYAGGRGIMSREEARRFAGLPPEVQWSADGRSYWNGRYWVRPMAPTAASSDLLVMFLRDLWRLARFAYRLVRRHGPPLVRLIRRRARGLRP